ncbi:MAG TPA: hypothetical protein VKT78_02365 [Fimbriimonadaceae bacterium]|nr:hypothetical protein [Fimbriimonadaceae bacterium]
MLNVHLLIAKLDYPPAPVMILATLACLAFIFGGGYWFRQADAKAKAERAALQAAAKNGEAKNP